MEPICSPAQHLFCPLLSTTRPCTVRASASPQHLLFNPASTARPERPTPSCHVPLQNTPKLWLPIALTPAPLPQRPLVPAALMDREPHGPCTAQPFRHSPAVPRSLDLFLGMAVMKDLRLGALNNANGLSQSPGGWKSKIKVSAGLVPSGGCWPPLASRLITPVSVFILHHPFSLHVCVPEFPLLIRTPVSLD